MKKIFTTLSLFLALFAFQSMVLAGDGWFTNLEEAQKQAQKEGKDLLVDFTGSDWCGWCIRLKKEVFSTEKFKAEAPKKFVFVEIDFPRSKPQTDEVRKYNRELGDRFGVTGYPTIMLLDAQGRPYGKTGYKRGGPEKYLEHLSELQKVRAERDAMMKEAAGASGKEKAQKLEKVMAFLNKKRLASAYIGLQEEIIGLDSDNSLKLKEKYCSNLAQHYHGKDKAKFEKYLEMAKQINPQVAKNLEVEIGVKKVISKYFRIRKRPSPEQLQQAGAELQVLATKGSNGETAQKLYYYIGFLQYQTGQKEKGLENLQKAYDFAPNSRMGQQIKRVLGRLKK